MTEYPEANSPNGPSAREHRGARVEQRAHLLFDVVRRCPPGAIDFDFAIVSVGGVEKTEAVRGPHRGAIKPRAIVGRVEWEADDNFVFGIALGNHVVHRAFGCGLDASAAEAEKLNASGFANRPVGRILPVVSDAETEIAVIANRCPIR